MNSFDLLKRYLKLHNSNYKYINITSYQTISPFVIKYTYFYDGVKENKEEELNMVDYITFVFNIISEKKKQIKQKKNEDSLFRKHT